jgi:hypothetical protein
MIDLQVARTVYINYLRVKIEFEDWHGVRDIAAELEVIDAKIALQQVPHAPDPTPPA